MRRTEYSTLNLTLKLFNAVPKKEGGKINDQLVKEFADYGLFISPDAIWAVADIAKYIKENKLDANQLNATFHKSWNTVKNATREELLLHQILHYYTTYGTDFTSDFIYIPAEKLDIPAIKEIPLKVIKGLTVEEICEKCLDMLRSGIALSTETIDDLLSILRKFDYEFTNVDDIKNKEALIKIISNTGIYPTYPVEFLRYLLYSAISETLIIKNKHMIDKIKKSTISIDFHVNRFGVEKCATIFNRYKPLWLAFKGNPANKKIVNKISKLSKSCHIPMKVDVLNNITFNKFDKKDIKEALKKANSFRKIRLLYSLKLKLSNPTKSFYRIRNGKSYVENGAVSLKGNKYYKNVYKMVYKSLLKSLDLKDKVIIYPKNMDYALPSSEKMFVGNIPSGTVITSKRLASGIYWRNNWGARDLDLSSVSIDGTKVGWNSKYSHDKGSLIYSGDITNAPNGAAELMYTDVNLKLPSLVMVNIFSGTIGCGVKLISGKAAKTDRDYMFDPQYQLLNVDTKLDAKQQIIGLFIPNKKKVKFVVINTNFGNIPVSSSNENTKNALIALYEKYSNTISLSDVLLDAGAILVQEPDEKDSSFKDKIYLDLSYDSISKDTFIKMFS